jgi:heme A synthase
MYLMTYALDSVGDVFCSLAALATGLLVMRSGALPRPLGWFAIVAGIFFFLQGFGLGGVIVSFGLVLDLIAFVLFLIFILVSSVILLRRGQEMPVPTAT